MILQATSFCNLNCDYCYLPDRQSKKVFNLDLIEPIFKNIFSSPLLKDNFAVCWHAGEPLAVPISFYEQAIAKINQVAEQYNHQNIHFDQDLQTNATLINQAWCDLFIKHDFQLSVSLDGPDFIHDAHRKTRKGLGTHAGTMRGIKQL
ncbi:MAG: radical SAM protein [Cyanobacteria bacterium P01_D01_bin.50]